MQEEARKKELLSKENGTEMESSSKPVEEKEGEDNKDEKEEKSDKQKPLPGNGGVAPNYWWQQSLEEATAYITLPDNIKAKDLDVKIDTEYFKVAVKGQPPIVEGKLHRKIKKGDTLWSLESDGNKRVMQVTFTKVDGQYWWDSIIEGDPKIDT